MQPSRPVIGIEDVCQRPAGGLASLGAPLLVMVLEVVLSRDSRPDPVT
jgi:hypothetical protein